MKLIKFNIFSAFLVFVFIVIFLQTSVAADDLQQLKEEIKYLKNRISQLERKVQTLQPSEAPVPVTDQTKNEKRDSFIQYTPGEGVTIRDTGLKVSASMVLIGQGAANTNVPGKDAGFGGSLKTDVDFQQSFYDWGEVFFELEMGEGTGAAPRLSLFSNVNNNADDTDAQVIFNKGHYAQYLFDKNLTFMIGKMDPTDWVDANNYAGDDSRQFLNEMFNNSKAFEWPDGKTFAVRADFTIPAIEFLKWNINYFDYDDDWDDIMSKGVFIGQVNFRADKFLGLDHDKWEGNYRLYSWINFQDHLEFVDDGSAPSDDDNNTNYGFGISWDQTINEVYGIFGRFGWQRPDVILVSGDPTIEWMWQFGAQVKGDFWKREKDVIGVSIGQLFPSHQYKRSGNPGGAEGHAEIYYTLYMNDYINIGPDFQLIWHPDGVLKKSQGKTDPIFVYGVRACINF